LIILTKTISKDDYHTLYLKNKKIIFPANNINGLASELFDSLFNKNKENSFKKFQKILTSQIIGDDQKEHWFEMTFKNDEIKNYFLDKVYYPRKTKQLFKISYSPLTCNFILPQIIKTTF